MRPAIGFTSRRRQRRHRVVERTREQSATETHRHRGKQTLRTLRTQRKRRSVWPPNRGALCLCVSAALRLNFLCVLEILCVAQDQNTSRSANCITRGSPASLVIVATAALLMFDSGTPNSSALKRLNTSQRSSTAV